MNFSQNWQMAKIFLIGPTVNLPRLGLDVFVAVAGKLQRMGHEVVIPHDLFHEEENGMNGLTVEEALERMTDELDTCKHAVLVGDVSGHDPFAGKLLFYARRRIMSVVPVSRICIDLKSEPVAQ